MEKEFKCPVCNFNKYHERVIEEGRSTDKILDIRHPRINARITFKACANCHVIFAYWEDFQDAEDIPQDEKDISNEVLKKEEEQ